MKKKQDQQENFLDLIPERLISWEVDENERVFLIKERSRNRWIKKLIDLLHRSQYFHIHLDELGTEAWLLADEKKSVLQISKILEQKFFDRSKGIELRAAKFFAMLQSNGFVRLRKNEKID